MRPTGSLTGHWRCEVPITPAASASAASASGRTFDGPQPNRPSAGFSSGGSCTVDALVIGGRSRIGCSTVSVEEAREPTEGTGYAVASLDGLGEGVGFRQTRSGLRV